MNASFAVFASIAHAFASFGPSGPQPAPLTLAPPTPPPPPAPTLAQTLGHMVLPLVGYIFVIPLVYFFFRRTWRELDVEALEYKRASLARGETDKRPLVLFVLTAVILTLQYYYDRDFFVAHIRPFLRDVELHPEILPWGLGSHVSLRDYGELYGLAWWVTTRLIGYIFIPFIVWKIVFPRDSLLDMGLRTRGLASHMWIYALCLFVVIPAVFMVARQPDFGNYYPFYKKCSRSWGDLLVWESLYVAQFLGLEIFFRGFWLNTLRRSLGSGAIFAMVVPYCMIHYGKPYLETCGAIVAGIALGSLSMRTKSIYSGFFVHITVALLMDFLAITGKGGLPIDSWPARSPDKIIMLAP
ncbi:MAG: CPBP family intramembrane glutamic endopeptidase [Polyangiaceae bacterium]